MSQMRRCALGLCALASIMFTLVAVEARTSLLQTCQTAYADMSRFQMRLSPGLGFGRKPTAAETWICRSLAGLYSLYLAYEPGRVIVT